MSLAGEADATNKAIELQNAAVVGTSQAIPFVREMTRTAVQMPVPNPLIPVVAELDRITRTIHYPTRSTVFLQGEQAAGVFIINRGTVKLSMTSSKGRAVIVRIAQAGEMLALSAALSAEPCIATAETLEDTEVAFIEREQFLKFLMCHPAEALDCARQASAVCDSAYRQISLLGLCRSAAERVAQFLLNWAAPKLFQDGQPEWLGLTHEEISQVAGTTRETVTRTLIDFRNRGWAFLASSKLVIRDREALQKMVA